MKRPKPRAKPVTHPTPFELVGGPHDGLEGLIYSDVDLLWASAREVYRREGEKDGRTILRYKRIDV